MSLTNPPAIVTQFSTQLAACASWTTGTAGHWYPSAVGNIATLHAVLASLTETRTRYAEGADGLPSGTLKAMVYVPDTIGNAELLGRALILELCAQYTGLMFTSGNVGLSADPGPAKVASGDTLQAIELTVNYGLSA